MRHPDTSWAACALLLACGDTSIGEDICTGAHAHCAVNDLIEPPTPIPWTSPDGYLDSSKLRELEPSWQHALSFVPEHARELDDSHGISIHTQGMLLGNGTAGLLHVTTEASPDGLEIYELDARGEAIDSTLIAPPPRELEATSGDSMVYRLDTEGDWTHWQGDAHQVLRNDYSSLAPRSVTEDRAGNLFVLSRNGPRDTPSAVLCKLSLAGDLSCYTLMLPSMGPSIASIHPIGGAEDVVYIHYLAESGTTAMREMLARFDMPCELAARAEGAGEQDDLPPSSCAAPGSDGAP